MYFTAITHFGKCPDSAYSFSLTIIWKGNVVASSPETSTTSTSSLTAFSQHDRFIVSMALEPVVYLLIFIFFVCLFV